MAHTEQVDNDEESGHTELISQHEHHGMDRDYVDSRPRPKSEKEHYEEEHKEEEPTLLDILTDDEENNNEEEELVENDPNNNTHESNTENKEGEV